MAAILKKSIKKHRHISAMVGLIATEFGTMVQINL